MDGWLVGTCFVGGALVAWSIWALMRQTFAAPAFARENVRGRSVPTGVGIVAALTVLVGELVFTAADALGADVDAATTNPRRIALLAVVGFAMLGLLDDLGGAGESKGFRGHLASLVRGRATTGIVKLFGGAALAVVVVAAGTTGRPFPRVIADAALVALAANLGNLLDRAPGRATKGVLLAFSVLAVGTGAGPELVGVAIAVGGAAGLLVPDLRERLMLGDAGANATGGAVGLGVVLACSPATRVAVLVAVAALNLASEAVSFSRVIQRVPPLRALDRLGRVD